MASESCSAVLLAIKLSVVATTPSQDDSCQERTSPWHFVFNKQAVRAIADETLKTMRQIDSRPKHCKAVIGSNIGSGPRLTVPLDQRT